MVTDAASSPRLVVLLRRLQQRPAQPADELLGACEHAAVSAGLGLRARLGGTVTAVTLGHAAHEEPVLAAALAAGCDRAVLVPMPEGLDLEYLGVATVLRAAVTHLGCDLLLCGDRSQEERSGAVGPAVAELLNLPHLTSVLAVDRITAEGGDKSGATEPDRSPSNGHVVMVQHRSGGRIHRFRCPLPAVLCMLGSVAARTAGLAASPAEAEAESPAIEHIPITELGLNAEALGRRDLLLGRTRAARSNRRLTPASDAADLVARLVADRVLR